MCGIVGATSCREVTAILMEGLNRLEYRGYDSAGIATLNNDNEIIHQKSQGKVKVLEEILTSKPLNGKLGIAHTRWATHGKPSDINAHPHLSGKEIAIVHNGIIENHEEIRNTLLADGYTFQSETDTEVIAHLIHRECKQASYEDCLKQEYFLKAVKTIICQLEGAFALAIMHKNFSDSLVVARKGSPLVIGVGIGENFIASDSIALRQVTDRFIYLEEGDIATVSINNILIWDQQDNEVNRDSFKQDYSIESADRGEYRHFMLKEIYEQGKAIEDTFLGRISNTRLLEEAFGVNASEIFDKIQWVQIVACGTSYHAGLIARYWFEQIAKIPCMVEVASEFRYREPVVQEGTLFLTISQSGETLDTISALRASKDVGYIATMTICNVMASSLMRESDIGIMTHAGPEIGVASTKAFTTQLIVLLLLTIALGRRHNLSKEKESYLIGQIHKLPSVIQKTLALSPEIEQLSKRFIEKDHALFLGRGSQSPVAMEGALKLKEISYIHAEAYAAGELKHGPLALVDSDMPVLAIAPNNILLEKLKSNLQEVRARDGEVILFADETVSIQDKEASTVIKVPAVDDVLAPIVYTIPLQLLAYHVAVQKGTDVDQPRNLAKSVTVE